MTLEIELGRYKGLERDDRLCPFCDVMESEEHAIYTCTAYDTIRKDYDKLLIENPSLAMFLNPTDVNMVIDVGTFLKLIEERRKSLLSKRPQF